MPPAALIREPALAGPGAADYVDRLVEPRGRLLLRDAEAGKFIGAVALADAENETAVRQQIEGRGVLGSQHRVWPGQSDQRGGRAVAGRARPHVGTKGS